MKFQAPPACLTVTCSGATFAVAPDGSFEGPPGLAADLRVHGCLPCPETGEAEQPITRMNRAAILAALEREGAPRPFPKGMAALRAHLRRVIAARPPSPSSEETPL